MMHTQKAIAAMGFGFYISMRICIATTTQLRIPILDKKQNKTPQNTKTTNSLLSGAMMLVGIYQERARLSACDVHL